MMKQPVIPLRERCHFIPERHNPLPKWQSCKRHHARRRRGSFYPCRRRPSVALVEVMEQNELCRSSRTGRSVR